ncbi:MAG: MFS transporter, partial [Proteobacteria bacterium]|nr:MFS transporter [Pseudomonadota bacterium]
MIHALRAFRHRSFRLFMFGQGVSQIGTWLQLIATSWLVYKLSNSAFLLGLATFALQIPFLLLSPVAAVWIDQLPKRRVLFCTQTVALLQSTTMFVLVASGHIEAWHLIAGNFVLGLSNSFDGPSRQSFLIEMVEGKDDLPNAIAMQSTIMNGARFVGPMIGGIVISALGETWGFGLNAVSYLAVLGALFAICVKARIPERGGDAWLTQFTAGFRWAFGFLPTRCALLLLASTSLATQPYQSLMPYFAKAVYHGDSHTLGLLLSAAGFGAVSAMVYLATRPSVRGLLTLLPSAVAVAGVALIAFSFCRNVWLAIPLVYVIGAGIMLTAASTNTLLQSLVEDRLRARVAAIYIMSFLGMSPIG